MLTILKGGHVVDPVNGRDGVGDVYIEDGLIVAAPTDGRPADEMVDCTGTVVMAGAIDIHSHIAGGHVNTARLLLPEYHKAFQARPGQTPLGKVGWTTEETGILYAEMGFTTVVEPAMAPSAALHAHLELADIPIIDKATLVVLGNDDFLLSMLRAGESEQAIEDYVAWTVSSARSLGVKTINAGGSAAFKENVRAFSFDDTVPDYGVTSRQIVKALQGAVSRLGVAASAARPLQQSRPSRVERRIGGDDHAGGGRRAAAPRPHPVLRLRQGGQPRLLLGGGPARRDRQRFARDHRRHRPGDVRPDRDGLVRRAAPVRRARRGQAEEERDPGRAKAMAAASCRSTTSRRITTTPCNGRSGSNCSC